MSNASLATPSRAARAVLGLAGIIPIAVGLPIFLDPVLAYQEAVQVVVPQAPALLSDLRAMASSLLAVGGLLLAGTLWRRFSSPAALIGTLLYLAYGLSRLVSMGIDGMPGGVIIGAMVVELAVGGLLAVVALRWRPF